MFALLLAVLVPQPDSVWQCEGRVCSTNPRFCCCVSWAGARDGNCRRSPRPASGAAACSTKCRCVLVAQAGNPARLSTVLGLSGPVFHSDLLPAAPATAPEPPSMPSEPAADAGLGDNEEPAGDEPA